MRRGRAAVHCVRSNDVIAQLHHARAHLPHAAQLQRGAQHLARKQRPALAQRDRAHLHDEFVEQSGVMELAGQVAPADDPEVAAIGSCAHGRVNLVHIAADKMQSRAVDAGQRAMREYPRGLRVRPGRARLTRHQVGVAQHPFVRRRPHGQRAHVGDELRVAGVVEVSQWKEPLQRVVFCGDEAVEAGGGVVLGFHGVSRHWARSTAFMGTIALSCLSVKGCASGSLFAAATMRRFSASVGMRMEGLLNALDIGIHRVDE